MFNISFSDKFILKLSKIGVTLDVYERNSLNDQQCFQQVFLLLTVFAEIVYSPGDFFLERYVELPENATEFAENNYNIRRFIR